MPKQYTNEEFWKLYEKLPKELQEVIFSEETAEHIGNTCERYDIKEETISEIAEQVGNVLLGILPPDEFQKTLETELKLEPDIAKRMAQDISRFIFYPVKTDLEELYKVEIAPPANPTKITPPPEEKSPTPSDEDIYHTKEKPPAPSGKDVYRETIE